MKGFWWIVIGCGLVVAVVLWWMKRRSSASSGAGSDGTAPKRLMLGAADFPLKKGSRGREVLYLQCWLNTEWQYSLTLDGIFGSQTLGAWSRTMILSWGSTSNQVSWETYTIYIKPREAEFNTYIKNKGITVI